jgi:hypothetical protein
MYFFFFFQQTVADISAATVAGHVLSQEPRSAVSSGRQSAGQRGRLQGTFTTLTLSVLAQVHEI